MCGECVANVLLKCCECVAKVLPMMHDLVQASDFLGTYRLVCNVPEILIYTHSSPTPRLGAFEVSAVWLVGDKVLRLVPLFR